MECQAEDLENSSFLESDGRMENRGSWARIVISHEKPHLNEIADAQVCHEGECPEVKFSNEAVKKLEAPFQFAAIAGLYGGKGRTSTDFGYVFASLRKQWVTIRNPRFSIIGNGRFLIRVDSEAELEEVIRRRAWSVGGRLMIASRWSPGQEMKINAVETVMVWIQLPLLPLHLWNEYCYKGIAKALRGVYVEEDLCSSKWEKVGFARIKLEVPISFQPLPRITLDLGDGRKIAQEIVYETRISYCDLCGALTHMRSSCKKIPNGEVSIVNPWASVRMATKAWRGIQGGIAQTYTKPEGRGKEVVTGLIEEEIIDGGDKAYVTGKGVSRGTDKGSGAKPLSTTNFGSPGKQTNSSSFNPFQVLANSKQVENLVFPPGFAFQSRIKRSGKGGGGEENNSNKELVRATKGHTEESLGSDSLKTADTEAKRDETNEWIKIGRKRRKQKFDLVKEIGRALDEKGGKTISEPTGMVEGGGVQAAESR